MRSHAINADYLEATQVLCFPLKAHDVRTGSLAVAVHEVLLR